MIRQSKDSTTSTLLQMGKGEVVTSSSHKLQSNMQKHIIIIITIIKKTNHAVTNLNIIHHQKFFFGNAS